MSEVGKAISNAFTFVSQVGEECEALANLIKQEVSELFRQDPLSARYRPGEWSNSYKTNENGWIYTDIAWSLPLVPKGKQNVAAHLGFQISLLCRDAEAGSSPEPLLHVNFWETATDLKNGEYMGFPMYGLSPNTVSRFKDGSGRLFRWETDSDAADWWTYSLLLAKVNSLEDVRSSIGQPIEQLLSDIDAGEILIDTLSAAVCYTAMEEVLDYYQVVS